MSRRKIKKKKRVRKTIQIESQTTQPTGVEEEIFKFLYKAQEDPSEEFIKRGTKECRREKKEVEKASKVPLKEKFTGVIKSQTKKLSEMKKGIKTGFVAGLATHS
jgi:hypothetical protein